jgi:hypothetical protein
LELKVHYENVSSLFAQLRQKTEGVDEGENQKNSKN